MAYSQFKSLHAIRQGFGLSVSYRKLFDNLQPFSPSEWLLQTLEITRYNRLAFFSEKSRSEAIVFPVLVDVQRKHDFKFALYSGAILDADSSRGLSGECDFVLSLGQQSIELERPLFCVVEAKDNDLDLGVPQCIAQMVGARIFNEQIEGFSPKKIFGAVTTGETWVFLKLENNEVWIDTQNYYLTQLEILLGVLDAIVREFLENA